MKFRNKIKKFGLILLSIVVISTIFLLNFVITASAEVVDSGYHINDVNLTFEGLYVGARDFPTVATFRPGQGTNSIAQNNGSAHNVNIPYTFDNAASQYLSFYYMVDLPQDDVLSFSIFSRTNTAEFNFERVSVLDTHGTWHALYSSDMASGHLSTGDNLSWRWSGRFVVEYYMPQIVPLTTYMLRNLVLVDFDTYSGTQYATYTNLLSDISDGITDGNSLLSSILGNSFTIINSLDSIDGHILSNGQTLKDIYDWVKGQYLDVNDGWYAHVSNCIPKGNALDFTPTNMSGTVTYNLYNVSGAFPVRFQLVNYGFRYSLRYFTKSGANKSFSVTGGILTTLPDDFYMFERLSFTIASSYQNQHMHIFTCMSYDDGSTDTIVSSANFQNQDTGSAIGANDQAERDLTDKASDGSITGKTNAEASSDISRSLDNANNTFGYSLAAVSLFINDFVGTFSISQTVLYWGLAVGILPLILGMTMHNLSKQQNYRANKSHRDKYLGKGR